MSLDSFSMLNTMIDTGVMIGTGVIISMSLLMTKGGRLG